MKKIGTIFVMMFLFFGMMTFVSAEELEIEDAGSVPGDFFYGFDRAMDNFKVAMTFNQERKSERELLIAEERLAEYQRLISLDESELAEKAMENYNKRIEKSKDAMNKVNSEKNSEKALRNSIKTQEKIEEHKEKLNEIYTRILEANGENMTDEQINQLDTSFAKAKNSIDKMDKEAADRKDLIKSKYKILSDLNESEIDELEDEILKDEGIDELKELRENRTKERFEREIEVRERNIERFKESLFRENLTEDEKLKIQKRVDAHLNNFEDFKERKEGLKYKFDLKKMKNFTEDDFEEEENGTEKIDELENDSDFDINSFNGRIRN